MLHWHVAVVHADSVVVLAHMIMGMHVRVRWMIELSRWGLLILIVRLVVGEHAVVVVAGDLFGCAQDSPRRVVSAAGAVSGPFAGRFLLRSFEH